MRARSFSAVGLFSTRYRFNGGYRARPRKIAIANTKIEAAISAFVLFMTKIVCSRDKMEKRSSAQRGPCRSSTAFERTEHVDA